MIEISHRALAAARLRKVTWGGAGAALAALLTPTIAAADDYYWVSRVPVGADLQLVRGITDDGRLALSDSSSPEQASFYDIYSGASDPVGHPDYGAYQTMTLFVLNDVGDVGGRGNAKGEGSRPIAYVKGSWLAPGDPSGLFAPEVHGVAEDGSLLGQAFGESSLRALYLPPGKTAGADWVVLPQLNPDQDGHEFNYPRWIGAGDLIYGTATLKWYEWSSGQGEYASRAVKWTKSGSEWTIEQLVPAPTGWTGNDDPDAKNADTWRSEFVAANQAGEVVGWLQEEHDAPLRLAVYTGTWTFLTPLTGTDEAAPEDLNDNGIAIGVGEAVNNQVAVVWDIRTDTAWNLNRSVDPSLKLIFTDGAAINDRGQILAKAKCEGEAENWYVLSPKSIGSPNLTAHDATPCATTPSPDSLGPPGKGNEQGLPPPGDSASSPPLDGSGGSPSGAGGTSSSGGSGSDGLDGLAGAGLDEGSVDGSDEGCGCQVAGASSRPRHPGWLLLAGGALFLARRRSRQGYVAPCAR